MLRFSALLLCVACLLFGVNARAATITVTTVSDAIAADGACSLREAMVNADHDDSSGSTDCAAGSGADTIVFSVDGTIALGSMLPATTDISKTTVDGTGHTVVVDGFGLFKIFKISAGAFELKNLTITRGKAGSPSNQGGGADVAGALTVTGCTFLKNGGGQGGAISVRGSGTLLVVDSTFSGNNAVTAAMIHVATSGAVDISRSLFTGNRPGANCGIQVGSGPVTISNSTFFDNAVGSGYSGAAICSGSGTLTIVGSTFLQNVAATLNGGTIYNGGYAASTIVLRNTIIDGAGGTTVPCFGAMTDGGGNIDTGTSCGFTTVGGSFPSTASGLDPAGPKDNGGPTQTIALLAGSAAIDKGDPATCAAAPTSGADQRGKKRPLDGDGDGTATCDIGAFEVLEKNGIACTGDGDCVSAHCVDSICCDTACVDGTCASGACVPLPPDAGPGDTGLDSSSDTGVADTTVADTAVSDTGSPDVGVVTDVAPADPSKPPVVEGNAKSCTTASECPSGFCVDHVCCNEACEGTCRSCALPQAPGICALQPLGYDLRNECESDRPCFSTCANGACVPSFAGAHCADNQCTGPSTGRGIAVCSALKGECQRDKAIEFDCSPYACAPAFGACLRDCTASSDCAPGFACDLGSQHCVSTGGGEDSGGCAFGRGSSSGFAVLLALFALGRTRRRR